MFEQETTNKKYLLTHWLWSSFEYPSVITENVCFSLWYAQSSFVLNLDACFCAGENPALTNTSDKAPLRKKTMTNTIFNLWTELGGEE